MEKIVEYLKNKKIMVVGGGFDGEREVSINSANNVINCLSKKGIKADFLELSRTLLDDIKKINPDIVYNSIHGFFGEDGRFQGVLDFLRIPYTGEQFYQSSICFDKTLTKQFFIHHQIKTPVYFSLYSSDMKKIKKDLIKYSLTYPLVLKKNQSGSSVDVYLIKDESELNKKINDIHNQGFKLSNYFLEEYIKGKEITVGIICHKGDIHVLPFLGLNPKGDFYDYHSKYTAGQTVFEMPAILNRDLEKKIIDVCYNIFTELDFSQCVRIDFMIDEIKNDAYALEINTSPGFTHTSDIPQMLDEYGIDRGDFCLYNLYKSRYFSI